MEAVLAQKRRVRSPVGCGLFYPEDRGETLEILKSFGLDKGKGGYAKAIVAPHGAWRFSGVLAANAFLSALGRSGNIRRVVILGPCHDKREKGIFLSNSYSFYTPLGNLTVDHKMSEELEFAGSFIEINDIPHLGEHSIEILLPFVKYCFPNASIVPVLMGQPEAQYINDLAGALKKVITPVLNETLIVVSCNLSCDNDDAAARFQAQEVLRLFLERDSNALASAILDGRLNACGGALVVSLFESGLVDKTKLRCAESNLVSAVSAENSTVYYSELSFA
ncbi:MAG: AmmeMemoRadiSam system protein B [Treponema sp.]|nr:AmmeMemoRadiSam system protein B [Treponema sp.]